ncbi:MAG: hypothetical protein ACKO5K_15485 [Armatimonadota bacterium]
MSVLIGGMATTMFPSAASAQIGSKDTQTNAVALKVGSYMPSKGFARAASANGILSFEADYTVQSIPEKNETSVISLGFIEKGDLRILPLTLNQIFHDKKRTTSYDLYYGFGVGLYSIRLRGEELTGNTKVMPGAAVTFGLNLSETSFIEARYHHTSDYESKRVKGLQLSYGIRF